MCSIQRPLDTKTQPRIAVEAEAILGALTLCDARQVELMSSDTSVFELRRNPHPVRREYALKVLAKAVFFIATNDDVVKHTRKFEVEGMKPLDPCICRRP